MVGGSHQEKRISLFYSYSHRDEVLRDKLDTHLAFLRRSERITEWHDRKIGAGNDWRGQIDRRLAEADIILLLVSADFIASDYCWGEEMTKALERHQLGEARVIPVILRPCQWQKTPLRSLQAVPKDGKPISEWPSHDAALDDIAAAVEGTIADLQPIEPQEVAPPPRPIDPLPPLPQRFIGRVNERASLIKTLTNEPRLPAVVLGGPGMGKSTLCVKVINQDDVKKAYDRICYVRLDSIITTDAMIAKLRDNLGLIASRSAFKQVMGELEHCSSLLFLDNFEDYWWSKPKEAEDILSHLAQIQQSTFVITLRGIESPLGPQWGARIDLPPLSYDESRILFTSTSEKDEHFMDSDALDEIIRSMDGIPLAIVLMESPHG
jgi:TIR domain/NB-ARC domain